jgi:hypothetical protein
MGSSPVHGTIERPSNGTAGNTSDDQIPLGPRSTDVLIVASPPISHKSEPFEGKAEGAHPTAKSRWGHHVETQEKAPVLGASLVRVTHPTNTPQSPEIAPRVAIDVARSFSRASPANARCVEWRSGDRVSLAG